MNGRKLTIGVVSLALLIAASTADAGRLNSLDSNFVRTGQEESFIQSWQVFGGHETKQEWTGLIEMYVAGFGVNVPNSGVMEDAFYPIDPKEPEVPLNFEGALPPQGLHIGFNGCSATQECGAPRIETYLVFVDGVGFVDPPNTTINEFLKVIPYSPQHVYHFVIDLDQFGQITLGHGDGGVWDNNGHFAIQLFSVEQKRKNRRSN